jgi:hypothetical protein
MSKVEISLIVRVGMMLFSYYVLFVTISESRRKVLL